MFLLHEPTISKLEKKYVLDCLQSNWLSSGKYVDLFENEIKNLLGIKHAIACVNGTSSLHISLKLLNLNKYDEVIVPTITFVAPINAIKYNDLNPIFMDCNNDFNINETQTIEFIDLCTSSVYDRKLKKKITINNKTKKRIGALIIVHTFGNACKFDKLYSLCKKRNIHIIEDAAESLGTFYSSGKFKSLFTGTIGDIGCLSFNGNKIITSGGGGMIITNNNIVAKKARYFINQAKDNSQKYIHNEIGYNYRLSNVQSAIGYAQIKKIKTLITKKKKIHETYCSNFNKINGIKILKRPFFSSSNYWLNILLIDNQIIKFNKDKFILFLLKSKIQARSVWFPNHLQKSFKNNQFYNIEKAKYLVQNSICLPSSSHLKSSEVNKISEVILEYFS